MSEHLNSASQGYWGAVGESDGWRLILQPRGGVGIQRARGGSWETVESFPTVGMMLGHLLSVYDVPRAVAAVAEKIPPDWSTFAKADRRRLVAALGGRTARRRKRSVRRR